MDASEQVDPPNDGPSPAAVEVDERAVPADAFNGRRPEIDAELEPWLALGVPDRRTALQEVIGRLRPATAEALVRLCCLAHQEDDRRTLNLAFEALSKVVTPLLISQARGMSVEDRREQAQEVLLRTFSAIQAGKADFPATYFSAFAKRHAISLYRRRRNLFEANNRREEPNELGGDPLDSVPARIPSAEARALLARGIDRLPPKQRAVFIEYHLFLMTQEEIAARHGVTVRTIFSWLKKAETAVGITGDEHEC
jgi:RNA polymerase sigma factor (sigma-70 family)